MSPRAGSKESAEVCYEVSLPKGMEAIFELVPSK